MGIIWEAVLQKVERGSNRLAMACRDVRRAQDPEARSKAEREVSVAYLMEVHAMNRDVELQITPEESDALAVAATGRGYEEQPRVDPAAEERERREQNAAIFAAEAMLWKR
jgi:hypothetical protein